MTRHRATRFLMMPFLISTMAISLSLTSGFGQAGTGKSFDPDGSFWVHGAPPAKFSEFGAINLNAKKSRHLPKAGFETNDGKKYRFRALSVKRERFTFTTITVRGISYSFSGKFLKGGVFAAGMLDDETPVLEGTLRKFKGGKMVAEADMKFVYFGGT